MTRRAGKVWPARTPKREQAWVDPNDPKSPGYAARSRSFETIEANGTVRVDIGAPIHRTQSEPQPKLCKAAEVAPSPAAPQPAPSPEPSVPKAAQPREPEALKPGLGRLKKREIHA